MSDYSESLSRWLQSSPWDYFYTITTRRPRRDEIAFIRDIKNELVSCNSIAKVFVACEPFKIGHNLHAHGLILQELATPGEGFYTSVIPEYYLWNNLFHRFGRSRVEKINSRSQVVNYCVKYVTKITTGDNWNYFDLTDGV